MSHAAWLRSVSRFPQTTCAPPLIPNANHSSFAYSHIYPRSHPRGCSQCSVVTVPVHNAHVRSRSLTMPLGDSSPSPGSSVTSNILLRHTPSPRHIRPAAVTYANRLFDQFSPPIALLQSVIQQTQLLGHGIHLTLPILDRDRCLDPDLRTARTIRGLTGGRHGRPVETDPQHQCIPLCDEFRQRMPVDRNLRVGQVDAGDQILKSFDGKVQFTPQILGNLQRLLPLLHQHVAVQPARQLFDAPVQISAFLQRFRKFHPIYLLSIMLPSRHHCTSDESNNSEYRTRISSTTRECWNT